MRRDAREHCLRLLEVAEHRVAEDLAVARPGRTTASPGLGPGARGSPARPAFGTGSGRSSIWLNSEKMAAFAPMPSASERTATAVTNGVLKSVRKASLQIHQ